MDFTKLPMELCILINEYNCDHRNGMKLLMDELLYKHYRDIHSQNMKDILDGLYSYYWFHDINNYVMCDNIDYCENIYKKENGVSIVSSFSDEREYYTFCSQGCLEMNEWEWSIRNEWE